MSTIANPPEAPAPASHSIDQYPPPAIVKQQALLQDWAGENARFKKDPATSWEEVAKNFVWTKRRRRRSSS